MTVEPSPAVKELRTHGSGAGAVAASLLHSAFERDGIFNEKIKLFPGSRTNLHLHARLPPTVFRLISFPYLNNFAQKLKIEKKAKEEFLL